MNQQPRTHLTSLTSTSLVSISRGFAIKPCSISYGEVNARGTAKPDSTRLSALRVRALAGSRGGPDAGGVNGIARKLVAGSSSIEIIQVSCVVGDWI